jgi:spermidine synthase
MTRNRPRPGRDERSGDDAHPSARLSNGMVATIEEDRFRPGSFVLIVDGTPQSHVDVGDPRYLTFEYVRRMGHGIDLVAPAGEPITAVHLGGGAFTLPRYIEATRPGSRQQVVEIDDALVDFVRETLPLPRGASIRVRHGDARDVLTKFPPGLRGAVDLVVVDVFAGARTPAHVTSVEFYGAVAELLAPEGVVTVNVADGAGLAFARSQAATLGHVFSDVALVADPQMLKARRFGNVVAFASRGSLDSVLERLPRLVASDPVPAKVVSGAELVQFVAGAPVATDATAVKSPAPARSVFATRRGDDA